jgi:membrane associated rhomboid family serine protease
MIQFKLTPAVKGLSIAMLAIFIIERTVDLFLGGNWIAQLGLVPQAFVLELKLWQIFTYSFMHKDVMHLVLNLMMLVFIGSEIESSWGWRRFLRYYFWCAASAGVFYLLLQLVISKDQALFQPLIGASGAIYGLLIAYGILFGERVLLFMMLFPMKARNFVWVLAGVEFLTGVFGAGGGLSSAAHLAGMFGGFGYLWAMTRYRQAQRLAGKPSGSKKSSKSLVSKAFGKAGPKLKLIQGGAPETEKPATHKPKGSGEPPTWH